MQVELFELLKSILKARRISYAKLAVRLGVSEPTIKRIFAERDCKISRITQICNVLDLSLDDLINEANRIELKPVALDRSVEAKLATDPVALNLFLLLLDGMSQKMIETHYALDGRELFKIGRRLERLGLVEVMPDDRLQLSIQGPVYFHREGPLHKRLLNLNMEFVRSVYLAEDTQQSAYLTQTRRITAQTATHILARLKEVQRELSDLARRDQLTQPDSELNSSKLSIAFAPIVFSDFLSLDVSEKNMPLNLSSLAGTNLRI